MLNYIFSLQEKNPGGITKSNFKGWHSNDFDLSDEVPKKFVHLQMEVNQHVKIVSPIVSLTEHTG